MASYKHYIRMSLEEKLEIEKVLDKEEANAKGDEFDNLYQTLKEGNDKPEVEEEPNPTPSEDIAPTDASETPAEPVDSDADVSAESIFNLYEPNVIALETSGGSFGIYVPRGETGYELKHQIVAGGGKILKGAYDGASYVGNAIIDNAPAVGAKIAELTPGVVSGIKHGLLVSAGAIASSIIIVKKFYKNRNENYEDYHNKIIKLKSALLELNKKLATTPFKGELDKFNNATYINALTINGNIDFDKNGNVIKKMFDDFSAVVIPYVKGQTNSTTQLVLKALSKQIVMSKSITPPTIAWSGFNKQEVKEFKPDDSNLDMYTYRSLLPGNYLLMGYSPSADLEDSSSIDAALKESKIFMGVDEPKVKSIDECEYIPINNLLGYLNTLSEICDIGIKHNKDSNEIVKLKESLVKSTKSCFSFVDNAETKEVRADLIKHVSSKVEYIDKTFVHGSMAVQSYVVQYLKAATEYSKSLIKAYS